MSKEEVFQLQPASTAIYHFPASVSFHQNHSPIRTAAVRAMDSTFLFPDSFDRNYIIGSPLPVPALKYTSYSLLPTTVSGSLSQQQCRSILLELAFLPQSAAVQDLEPWNLYLVLWINWVSYAKKYSSLWSKVCYAYHFLRLSNRWMPSKRYLWEHKIWGHFAPKYQAIVV